MLHSFLTNTKLMILLKPLRSQAAEAIAVVAAKIFEECAGHFGLCWVLAASNVFQLSEVVEANGGIC